MVNPRCFVSYSWDSIEHREWVRKLASELQSNGVETHLDQWDTHLGIDLTNYVETCIRESDFVLLICTPLFCKKANAGSGGVGYEKMIVTGEIFGQSASPKKFVPILRAGSLQESLPSFLKSRFTLDFRNDNEFEQKTEDLLRHIHQVPKYCKPPLGSKPSFSEKTTCAVSVTCTPKKDSFDIFKDVYSFAYENTGMDLDRENAKLFATKWTTEFADKDFEEFKKIYLFAYSGSGMNLDHYTAKLFTINWMREFADKDFEQFKKMYFFAYSGTGMDLDRENAKLFATNWMTEEFADKDFEEFKKIYLFAYSYTGMNLSQEDAKIFATNEIKKRTET